MRRKATAGAVAISDRKFDKDDNGRWVVLFGMYEGELLSRLPCSYVSWMLRRCKFVKGPFRRAARELLRRREQNPCERCECGPDYGQCPAYDPREAKTAASALASRFRGRTVVLLGRAVARAFGLPGDLDFFRFVQHDGMTVAVAPHPSRVSRWWNEPDHEERARRFFDAIARGYVYRGDRLTDHSLVGRTCTAVRDARGKCVRGRLGTMLVTFEDGTAINVVARQLRRLTPRAIAAKIPERNQQ